MEQIRLSLQQLLFSAGLEGNSVSILSHIILVMAAFLLAWVTGWLCIRLLVPLILKLTDRTEAQWDDKVFNTTVLNSLCHIVPAIIIWQLLPLIFSRFQFVEEVLKRITAIYITVMAVRTSIVFINSLKSLEGGKRSSMQQYFHSFCGVFKIAVVFVATIVVVAIALGKSPLTLFAGLGATSAILMLVFKDTIAGLVAGVRLTSNDMLHKGDWITVPSTNADGTVEDITLTTVKIRNFDNTIVTVSPQTLVNGSFQNWIGMQQSQGRRVARVVCFDFNSITIAGDDIKTQIKRRGWLQDDDMKGNVVNMTLFRTYIEKYLSKNKDVNQDMTYMVRQKAPDVTGLPLEFYFFLRNKEWVAYEHAMAAFMEYVLAAAPVFGLKVYQRV